VAEIFALESLPQKFLKNSDRGCFLQKNKNHGLCKLTEILSDKIPKKKKGFFRGRPKMWMEFREIFHFESPFEKSSSPKSRFFNQCTLAHKEKISRQCNHLFKSNF